MKRPTQCGLCQGVRITPATDNMVECNSAPGFACEETLQAKQQKESLKWYHLWLQVTSVSNTQAGE